MLLTGLTELVSLGAVLPFLTVLSSPELIWEYSLAQPIIDFLGFTSPNQLLLLSSILFAITALLAGVIRLVNLWLNGILAAAIGSDLSCKVYKTTLYQPYITHVTRNSSSIISGITSHIGRTLSAISALLQMLTAGVVTLFISFGL